METKPRYDTYFSIEFGKKPFPYLIVSFLCPSELCYVRYKALNINTNTKATLEKKSLFRSVRKKGGR